MRFTTLLLILTFSIASSTPILSDSSKIEINSQPIQLQSTIKPKKEFPLWLDALIALSIASITSQFIFISQHPKN